MSVPLQKQLVELLFHKGFNTKGDPFQISIGELIVLQNATFTSPGKIQKRNAYGLLAAAAVANPTALFARGNELLQIGGAAANTLYSYSQSISAWVAKGAMPSVAARVSSVAQPQYSACNIDMAVAANGLQCFVFELLDLNQPLTGTALVPAPRQQHGIGYTIVDPATGQLVVPPSFVDATVATTGGGAVCSPHVLALGNTFVCYYVAGQVFGGPATSIVGRTLSATAPLGGWSASTAITSGTTTSAINNSSSSTQFDACVSGGNAYVAFPNRSTSGTIFKLLAASPLAVNATSPAIGAVLPAGVTVFGDVNGNIAYGAINAATTAVTAAVLDSALAGFVKASTNIETGLANLVCIAGVSTAAQALTFFYGSANGSGLILVQEIRSNTMTGASYTVGAPARVTKALSIAAKPFVLSGAAYLPTWLSVNTVAFSTPRAQSPQAGIFVLDATGRVLSKSLIGTNGGFDTVGFLQTTGTGGVPVSTYQVGSTVLSGSTAIVPASQTNILQREFISGSGLVVNYQFGAVACSFAFGDATNNYQRQQQANTVHTNGGVMQMYDGQQVVEHGFLMYPQTLAAAAHGSGGSLSAGKYSYIAVYSWMDGQGQLHRSAPSVVSAQATAVLNDSVTLTVPTLQVTAKSGVMIELYRTLANATAFFQITNFNGQGSLYNDKTVDTLTWLDTQSDVAISSNPQLYTAGGVVGNTAVNPAGAMVVHRGRLFVIDSTTGQIWFSKQLVPTAPVEFSDVFTLNVDLKGGFPSALASLDDKLIIYTQDRIFMVLGQGPDSTGNQNDFTDALPVSADTGCASPKSIVVVPKGIIYQSPKGIYLLDRALNVTYVGAPLEGLLFSGLGVASITSGVLMSEVTQVRFGVPSGFGGHTLCFTYDYSIGQWYSSSLNGHDKSIDACNVDGAYYNLTDTSLGAIEEQDGGTVDPFGQSILQSLTTGWIKIAGVQGFQRVYQMLMLGTGGGSLNVSVAYDYDPAIVDVIQIDAAFNQAAFQERVKFSRQKCEAIQLTIAETDARNGPGLSSLSALSFEIGIKKGPGYKLPASKTSGG